MTYNSSKTGAQVDAAVDDVQEAKAALATDTTAGRLLKVGDFGVGRASGFTQTVPDMDAINIPSGWHRIDINGIGTFPTIEKNGLLQVVRTRDDEGYQLWYPRFTESCYMREFRVGEGFKPWRELFHTGNLLGTVSQSGGVPTGAVIEQGSSLPSGVTDEARRRYWVRYADGTQIAWQRFEATTTIQTAHLGGFRSSNVLVTYGVTFAVAPTVMSGGATNNSLSPVANAATTTGVNINFTSVTSQADSIDRIALVVAHGRWFV